MDLVNAIALEQCCQLGDGSLGVNGALISLTASIKTASRT
jgi:hypothetical protein